MRTARRSLPIPRHMSGPARTPFAKDGQFLVNRGRITRPHRQTPVGGERGSLVMDIHVRDDSAIPNGTMVNAQGFPANGDDSASSLRADAARGRNRQGGAVSPPLGGRKSKERKMWFTSHAGEEYAGAVRGEAVEHELPAGLLVLVHEARPLKHLEVLLHRSHVLPECPGQVGQDDAVTTLQRTDDVPPGPGREGRRQIRVDHDSGSSPPPAVGGHWPSATGRCCRITQQDASPRMLYVWRAFLKSLSHRRASTRPAP